MAVLFDEPVAGTDPRTDAPYDFVSENAGGSDGREGGRITMRPRGLRSSGCERSQPCLVFFNLRAQIYSQICE